MLADTGSQELILRRIGRYSHCFSEHFKAAEAVSRVMEVLVCFIYGLSQCFQMAEIQKAEAIDFSFPSQPKLKIFLTTVG